MKKTILLIALGVSLCANAQLTVFENGQVRVGNNEADCTSLISTLDISASDGPLSSGTRMPSGSLTFGSGTGAYMQGCSGVGYLYIYAGADLELHVGKKGHYIKMNYLSDILTSTCQIKAPAFLTSSDARLKTNVSDLSGLYSGLKDVHAVSYNLTSPVSPVSDQIAAKDSAADAMEPSMDQRTHFGFIAQEVRELYPNLVVEDEDGLLSIDYTGFIPLLVEAYKDLSKQVKEQEETIEALLGRKGPAYMPASVNGIVDMKASLKQNRPNPFNTSTTIECTIPQDAASAFICVYDLQGKQVHRMDISERGDVASVIDASYLAPGMYIYALIIDGSEIDSKRMIITD